MIAVDYRKMIENRATFAEALYASINDVSSVVNLIAKAFEAGNKLFVFGNGGSAADAQHMTAEFVGKFIKDRRPLPAIALTTNSSAVTAIANDWSYDYVFKRQLEALAKQGDVVIGISTSGESKNVLDALGYASQSGLVSIGLTGNAGKSIDKCCQYRIAVGGDSTPIIQERMLAVEHIICEAVEVILRANNVI